MADVCDMAQANIERELDAVLSRSAAPAGPSAEYCVGCGVEIPQRRREYLPGVQLCVDCQALNERKGKH